MPERDNAKRKKTNSRNKAVSTAESDETAEAAKTTVDKRESGNGNKKGSHNPQPAMENPLHFWMPVALNAILILIVGWQAFIYRQQWQVMRDQLTQAKESTEAANRAWVLVKAANLEALPELGKSVSIKIDFSNFGQTPAKHLRAKYWTVITNQTEVAKFPPKIDFPPGPGLESGGVIAPGVNVHAATEPAILTQEQSDWLKQGCRYYIYGTLTYDDVFGHHHKTDFCLYNYPGTIYCIPNTDGEYAD